MENRLNWIVKHYLGVTVFPNLSANQPALTALTEELEQEHANSLNASPNNGLHIAHSRYALKLAYGLLQSGQITFPIAHTLAQKEMKRGYSSDAVDTTILLVIRRARELGADLVLD